MAEYIERDAVHDLVRSLTKYALASPGKTGHRITVDADGVNFGVDKIPSADVATVRHGRWEARAIPRSDPDGDWIALEYHCSLCNRLEYRKENYCPNCGCRMDGGVE